MSAEHEHAMRAGEPEEAAATEAASSAQADTQADDARANNARADDAQTDTAQTGHAQPEAAPAAEGQNGAATDPAANAHQDGAHDPTDHEHKLEQDLDELNAKAQKADEYLELAQRTKADFENYRRRAARDAAVAQERGIAKLAKELLPAVDNLDRALAAAEAAASDGGDGTLVSGIKLVQADVMSALARVGIEPYSPQGELFDPTHHEAVAQQPVDGAEPGTVVEVYQLGYRLGESILRPARVVVAG